ncbi:MAG: hypothetical protein GF335_03170 [Candidatus Moranbacteria bacterium]|nr:hypothetical protein [Candidatus Moranbacteria bacterium]
MAHKELKGDRCPKCNGSGSVIADVGGFHAEVDCPDCAGTGLVNSPNACKKCKGSGSVIVDAGGFNVEATCEHCNGSGLEPL